LLPLKFSSGGAAREFREVFELAVKAGAVPLFQRPPEVTRHHWSVPQAASVADRAAMTSALDVNVLLYASEESSGLRAQALI